MDRDHRITDQQYLVRKAVYDECIASSNMDHEWEQSDREGLELDLADPDFHYLAFQYSHYDNGNEWATLGRDPVDLIQMLSNDECWYSPHYVIDLDTGEQLMWKTTITITGRERSYDDLIASVGGKDQAAFLGLDKETP